MRGKAIVCFILLVAMVGVVSADTLIIYGPTAADGRISRAVDETFYNIRSGAGTAIDNTSTGSIVISGLAASTTSNQYNSLVRFGWSGNTTLPTGSSIDSAIFYVYGATGGLNNLGNPNQVITGFTPQISTVLQISDFDKFGNIPYSNNFSYASWNTSGYNGFNLNNDGLTAINTNGYTSLMIRLVWDAFNDTSGLTWSSGLSSTKKGYETSYSGNSRDPYLQIEYTISAGDTTPPASITGLGNSTTCNSINWTWTNPADADFNHTYIMKDNVFLHNVSNTTSFDLWTGLSELTSYTFSSKTVDITGNMNASWVNQTATTGACGSAPVAGFSVDNATVCLGYNATFTDSSSNTPTSWYWEFGEGNTSTLQNPSHKYEVLGLMNVNLKATNAYGSDWENKTGYITVTDCTPPAPPSEDEGFTGYAHFNFTAYNSTPMTDWNWSVDQVYVGNGTTSFLNTWLQWGLIHNITLTISNSTYSNSISHFYNLHNVTPTVTQTPTPWQPEIMPSTEFDLKPANIFSFWWIPAILLVVWLIFFRRS